ncbi:MAG: hypothetical protein NZ942_02610 [Candidatus Aenigmarchaeota archaeon]|nr:hypothetical protein [Candidatus Aenigmarchaeota archaeon]
MKKKLISYFITFLLFLVCILIVVYSLGFIPKSSFEEENNLCLSGNEPLYSRYEGPEKDNECSKDEDCKISGCSSEICHSEDLVSTCELIPTPKNDFGCSACKCVNGKCKWAK